MMNLQELIDNPQKSLTVVVIMAALGVLATSVLGFFFVVKSPELVTMATKTFETILIGTVGGKLALAQPGNGNGTK